MSTCTGEYSIRGQGCQVPVGSGICGETKSLSIINEFKRLYEEKMHQIDTAGGDCLQEKIKIQQEWIGDLTEQNEMLVRAVCELECEATERVQMLEEKLQQSAKSICEVIKKYRENDVTNELLAEPLQRIFHLENDQKNLLEFIRRIRDEKYWSIDGLMFYELHSKDLLKWNKAPQDPATIVQQPESLEAEDKCRTHDCIVRELQVKLERSQSCTQNLDKLSRELKCKNEECESLKQVLSETRQVLTEEVASKHDHILQLKRDIMNLEDRCIQADKQTAFKDDIIKELRKEIRQLKQQVQEEYACLLEKQSEMMLEKSLLASELERTSVIINDIQHKLHFTETSKNFEKIENLIQNMQYESAKVFNGTLNDEIMILKQNIAVKDKQLIEQLELIKILVEKLYNVYKGLEFLENRILSATCCNAKAENQSLKFKLLECKKCLECGLENANTMQVKKLEKAFKSFVKHKIGLEKKCKCLERHNKTLMEENEQFKCSSKNLRNQLEKLMNENRSLENCLRTNTQELDTLKDAAATCRCKIEELSQENRCRLNEVMTLNEENRQLSKTIDNLKKSLDTSSKITVDEVSNLTKRIEELNETLYERKERQDLAEKEYKGQIEQLNNTICSLNCELQTVNEKYHTKYQNRLEQMNDTVCKLNCELNDLKEKYKTESKKYEKQIEQLNYTVSDLNFELQKYHPPDSICPVEQKSECTVECDLKKENEKLKMENEKYLKQIEQLNDTLCKKNCELSTFKEKCDSDSKVCKICRGKSRVSFATCSEVQTDINNDVCVTQSASLQNKDEIIKVQRETISVMEQDLEKTKAYSCDMMCELERRNQEIQSLQNKISQIEGSLSCSEERANNLQMAVDLYLNSINVLEASEEKSKIDIQQQKLTITNLQQVLVATKQELDDVKRKSEENGERTSKTINILEHSLKSIEESKQVFKEKFIMLTEDFDHLQDLNFNLEIEHCNSLQDVELLENHLNKYQTLLKFREEECSFYKQKIDKLLKQKQRSEGIIVFFKREMTAMAEQLSKLQEMLTCSSDSVQDEYIKIMQRFNDVQCSNEQLCTKLNAASQQCQLEQQMCQLQEGKIQKLQDVIREKELELLKTENTVKNIRQQLHHSMEANEKLQATVTHLTQTICKLKCEVDKYEEDNCNIVESRQECKLQISTCVQHLNEIKGLLDQKTNELTSLEMDYNNQHRLLLATQSKLQELKQKEHDKYNKLKRTLEDVREKLQLSDSNHNKLCEDYKKLQEQLAAVSRREAVKDQEVKRYRKIVSDLKRTLVQLNKALSNKEFQNKCKNKECKKNMEQVDNAKLQDICLNCPCEVEFYQSMVDNLKQAIIALQRKVSDLEERNKQLEDEKKDICRKPSCGDIVNKLRKELEDTRQELQIKTMQLNDVKKSSQEINSTKCVQLACAQEEISNLKKELHSLQQKECALCCEVEKLQSQCDSLQSTVTTLEEKSQLLKVQLEHYLGELHHLRGEKEALMRRNRELLNELKSLSCSYGVVNKQSRCTNESAKIMEAELEDLKSYKDEISYEGRNVIAYVRAWLQEQKKINDHTIKKEKDYCDTIEKLKQQNKELQPGTPKFNKRVCIVSSSTPYSNKNDNPPSRCQSPWSLGSQGNASANDPQSPSQSPCLNEDWYSPTFRDDSDDSVDDWVDKLENLTCQVRKSNRMWQRETKSRERKARTPDYDVSRDHCKK